jgi:vacuolar iron transporter family protein
MTQETETQKYLSFLKDERNGAALYRTIAELEKNPQLAEVYRRLAETEENHARRWEEELTQRGVAVPAFKPDWRTRTLTWLARRLGVAAILPTLSAMEDSKTNDYSQIPDSAEIATQESSHARLLRQIGQSTQGGMEGGVLAQFEGRHRTAGGNALRAAVLGANDGLVSNFSLVMGVAGAALSSTTILLTGLAGLLAGAISMALGEWISVQSSRELYEKQIRIEKEEIAQSPEEEVEELALIYQARGLEEQPARQLAEQIMSNRETALATLSREELGIDPEELGGSAWEAAITSFVLFAIGAIIPVIPYMFLSGMAAIGLSALLSAGGLFVIGAAITLFTGRPVWQSGLRQVVFGLAAAAVTYLIGRLIGVNVSG